MMRCVGLFTNDRICDICKSVNPNWHSTCEELYHLRLSESKKDRCPHSEYKWARGADEYGRDESYQFIFCNKKGDNCNPDVNCLDQVFSIGDYVEGTEMYGDSPKKVRGWITELPQKDENGKLLITIKCDDQYKGARSNYICEDLGEIKKIKEEV